MAGLSAIPAFFKGTEDTGEGGNADSKKGFHAILHPHERVLTADQNRKVGDMTNEQLADLAYRFNATSFDRIPVEKAPDDRHIEEIRNLRSEISDFKKMVQNRPVKSESFDEINKLVVTTIRTQYNTVRKMKKLGGKNG
jgi:hypothetical protein